MALFEHFPYTNFHDLNLDWIIAKVKALNTKVDSFEHSALPTGGTTGQTLQKNSDTDYDCSWKTVPAGPQGPQGPQGPSGQAATITIGSTATGAPGTSATVINTGTTHNAVLQFTIPQGANGSSFTVKGLYATYADLIAAHPTGSAGDAYGVGTDSSNVVYFWSVDTSTWTNIGSLKGPKGDTGPQGPAGGTNRNLLDNPWFTVNQRGQSSYTAQGYTVDRWKKPYSYGRVTVNIDKSITFAYTGGQSWLLQILDTEIVNYIKGKSCTLSVEASDITGSFNSCYDDGTTHTSPVLTSGINSFNFTVPSSATSLEIGIVSTNAVEGNSITIKAIKLELGSNSTLADDIAPNYAEELAKCQRYCQVLTSIYIPTLYGLANASTDIRLTLPTCCNMRDIPTISVDLSSSLIWFVDGTNRIISSLSVEGISGSLIAMKGTVSGAVQQGPCVVRINKTMILSADL